MWFSRAGQQLKTALVRVLPKLLDIEFERLQLHRPHESCDSYTVPAVDVVAYVAPCGKEVNGQRIDGQVYNRLSNKILGHNKC